MIINATQNYVFGGTLAATFVERAWIPAQDDGTLGDNTKVDLDVLRRWLRGEAMPLREPPPVAVGPQAHVISVEYLRGGGAGNAQGVHDVLACYAYERPDIIRLVYDESLRVTADNPAAMDRKHAELTRRLRDPLERRIWALTQYWCPDWYWMGVRGRAPCSACGKPVEGGPLDPNVLDREATRARLPAYIEANEAVATRVREEAGTRVIPTIHERYHGGHGLALDTWMDPEDWRYYCERVRSVARHAVWWSGPVREEIDTPDGKRARYSWAARDRYEQYAEIAAKVFG